MGLKRLWQRYSQWLRRSLLAFRSRIKERGGWLSAHGGALTLTFFLCVLAITAMSYVKPPPSYLYLLALPFILAGLGLAVLLIVRFLMLLGRRGRLFALALIATLAAVRILQLWLSTP